MKSTSPVTILVAVLIVKGRSQIMRAYSDASCQTFVGEYACGDYWESCNAFPTGVMSYEITDSQGQNCNPSSDGIFNTFFLYSQGGCNGANCNAGGGQAGCETGHGCLITYNDDWTYPSIASTYFECKQDFGLGGIDPPK